MTVCKLLVDPPADGAWNMAVDETLLGLVVESGVPVLRFYQWHRPTLSLGYFQKFADRSQHAASLNADVVRRLSGGGAIVHDQELTYSLILPASHGMARDTQALYNVVHQSIAAKLNDSIGSGDSGWQAVLCETTSDLAAAEEPFLCFERRAAGDILLRKKTSDPDSLDHKIVGSAQRRRQGVVLQHGSLLLGQSEASPQLKGIAEITHANILPSELLPVLCGCLARELSLEFSEYKLSEKILATAQEIRAKKYASQAWNQRR